MALLIDFHTHFFSHRFFRTLAEASPLPGTPEERIEKVVLETGVQLPSTELEEHLASWQAEMKRFRIQHMVTFASVPEETSDVARAARLSKGQLTPFTVIDPTKEGAPERLRTAIEEDGIRGALLFPAMHRYRPDGPEVREVYEVLSSCEGTAIVHCGMLRVGLRDRFGLPRSYDLSLANPLHLVPAADTHPRVTFVIPHFGAGFFRETLIAGAQCANVFVDTSSSNTWMTTEPGPLQLADVFDRALSVFGPERILFGTDSSVFPRGWRQDLFLAQREALGACGLDKTASDKVFGLNAARILNLS